MFAHWEIISRPNVAVNNRIKLWRCVIRLPVTHQFLLSSYVLISYNFFRTPANLRKSPADSGLSGLLLSGAGPLYCALSSQAGSRCSVLAIVLQAPLEPSCVVCSSYLSIVHKWALISAPVYAIVCLLWLLIMTMIVLIDQPTECIIRLNIVVGKWMFPTVADRVELWFTLHNKTSPRFW